MAYAIAPPPIIGDLKKMKYSFNPYNVNRLTQIAAEAALDEDEYYKGKRLEIIVAREYAGGQLRRLGFTTTDSKANFLFVRHPKIGGAELYVALKERGVLVRHWDKPRISDYLRITVGTKEQMDALITAIEEIFAVSEVHAAL